MLEVKTTDCVGRPTIPHSCISENERKALTEFEVLIGQGHAFIIGLWLAGEKRAFLIPWYAVSDLVCSGCRGSILMEDFPELPRVAGDWDMNRLRKG